MERDLVDVERKLVTETLKYGVEKSITVYDAYYIILARNLNSPFYTADEKLLNRIQAVESTIHHIRDYRPRCAKQ